MLSDVVQQATPGEVAQFLAKASRKNLMELASKLNAMKGPSWKLAADSFALSTPVEAERNADDKLSGRQASASLPNCSNPARAHS